MRIYEGDSSAVETAQPMDVGNTLSLVDNGEFENGENVLSVGKLDESIRLKEGEERKVLAHGDTRKIENGGRLRLNG